MQIEYFSVNSHTYTRIYAGLAAVKMFATWTRRNIHKSSNNKQTNHIKPGQCGHTKGDLELQIIRQNKVN